MPSDSSPQDGTEQAGASPPPSSVTARTSSDAAHPSEDWWDHCPLCGTRLRNQGCKYRCPRCRYFMSCSDFD